MEKIKFYCVTNKIVNFINHQNYNFAWVGKDNVSNDYILCNNKKNIFYKEKYYSELTFHYWYWKNLLDQEDENCWVGFCQKRRFWIKDYLNEKIDLNNINKHLLINLDKNSLNYESIICDPISVSGVKKTKLIKRGWRNVLRNPIILFNKKYYNISLHFDMHHGYKNLEKAIQLLTHNDRNDFHQYVNSRDYYNPHIMCIARPKVLEKWFESLFPWLERCEEKFGYENLKGYDTQRLYAYLGERYLSFWFKKNSNYITWPFIFRDING